MNETAMNPNFQDPAAAPAATAVAEVPGGGGGAEIGSVLEVSDKMVALTWLAFLLACFALYKLAWKPICQALDRREDKIRQSLKEAADIQAQAEMDREAQKVMMAEATREAADIVARARTAAEATAKAVEEKSAADAADLIRAAQAEIGRVREQAVADLRREAAELAVDLAGRVLDQKLDSTADRELTERLIREIQ